MRAAAPWLAAVAAAGIAWVFALSAADPPPPPPPARPLRIVSTAPSVTEALFAVGAGDRVVAVSDFCTFPPAVLALPRVGGLYDTRLEALVGLHPDLVATVRPQSWLRDRLGALGVPAVALDMNSPVEVPAALEALGRAVGEAAAGLRARRMLDARVAALRRRVGAGAARRVLWVLDRDPDSLGAMTVLGPDGYLHGLLALAGGENVMASAGAAVPSIGAEQVIRLAPDVVLEHAAFYGHLGAGWRDRVARPWRELLGGAAVDAGRVVFVDDPAVVSPGPRMADALELLVGILHEGRRG